MLRFYELFATMVSVSNSDLWSLKMSNTGWKTTKPPKRKRTPVRLRYQDYFGKIRQGDFVWSDMEQTWILCTDDPDGIALYAEDGWKVLGWKYLFRFSNGAIISNRFLIWLSGLKKQISCYFFR